MKPLKLALLSLAILGIAIWAQAQGTPTDPCANERSFSDVGAINACPTSNIPLLPNTFHATPLMDGTGGSYGDSDNNKVALYGSYGNDERVGVPSAHYTLGTTIANTNFVPRCKDGSLPADGVLCREGPAPYPPAIIFLFLGFSNWDIEIGGGHSNIWQGPGLPHFSGQPCATRCENLNNPDLVDPWETVAGDPIQQSLLYQVYSQGRLVGPHVVLFNGAYGSQTLYKWDTTSIGYYYGVSCDLTHLGGIDPECNYHRVLEDLQRNNYTEAQVEAIFFKSSNPFPQCDLKHSVNNDIYCNTTITSEPDAYTSERYLGNILRYLRCCKLGPNKQPTTVPRYPNLQQVFLTSRTYGGTAQNFGTTGEGSFAGCLSPEPYAYEEGFAIQKLIVAQINGSGDDGFSGDVHYNPNPTLGGAPWFDWGPYLWASGDVKRNDNFFWCGGQPGLPCSGSYDVRDGDDHTGQFWGDYTHPRENGQLKVANQVRYFLTNQGSLLGSQSFITDWVTPWISK